MHLGKHILIALACLVLPIRAVTLQISRSGNDVLLSWTNTYWDYHLQFQPYVANPSAWTDFSGAPVLSNNLRHVRFTPTNQAGFFRLAQKVGRFTNSVGMVLVPLQPGTFTMGYWQTSPLASEIINVPHWVNPMGDYDERSAHQVTMSHPFWIGAFEVSNKEYEQFDPGHAVLRGKLNISTNDDEAVVFVSWNDATAFCNWLAEREGLPYRLPTEAEWEYACRAGTTTHFSTGDTLPAQYLNQPDNIMYPILGNPVTLYRGQTPHNPWGLYDMHGNVEEWCSDWYGPYSTNFQTNPVGAVDGIARVTRGGSHSTVAFYLRSENRMGALPDDKSWFIGLRVVIGDTSSTPPLPPTPLPGFQANVNQTIPTGLTNGPDPDVPYFRGPLRYVNYPGTIYGPVYSYHNHDPGGIVECSNGDLLTIWNTCVDEYGRELSLAASRLRYGATNWDTVSSFYDIPDRNDAAPCLAADGDKLYLFCGVAAAATWGPLALTMITSTNNGASWTKPSIVLPEHNIGHQPISSFLKTANGSLILPCDATPDISGGTVLWISRDNGLTWYNPAAGRPTPIFTQGNTGAWIAGIHAAITQLGDGRLLAIGRGDSISNCMPMSISSDEGTNWTYSASIFPQIFTAQRATLLRLREGPLFFASFAFSLVITNSAGGTRTVSGLFAALSNDNGLTWPYIRLVSDDAPAHDVETLDGVTFSMSKSNAEPYGYLASTQGPNGVIHLISSRQHYQFNLKWLTTRPPP